MTDVKLDANSISIISQVAFKAAVEKFDAGVLATDEGKLEFTQLQDFLSDVLVTDAIDKVRKYGLAPEPPKRNNYNGSTKSGSNGRGGGYSRGGGGGRSREEAAEAIKHAFPGTTEEPFELIVHNQQDDDLPAWLFEQAMEAGITEVIDQRDQLSENPKRPWFKQKGGNKGFWPPR